MATNCASTEHDYCRPGRPPGPSELTDMDLADLLKFDLNYSPTAVFGNDFETIWSDIMGCPALEFPELDAMLAQSTGGVADDLDDGYTSGLSPPSAPSPIVSETGTSTSSCSMSTGLAAAGFLELGSVFANDVNNVHVDLSALGLPPSLPVKQQQGPVSQGCATSVLKGTGSPGPAATAVSPPSVPNVPATIRSTTAKVYSEKTDPRLSGPTSFMANSVCWQYGQLKLTTDELSVLEAESLPIPTSLPLTPDEEKAIKQVRRKIKNKISAQESRRKRKQYIDSLEDQLSVASKMNQQLMDRISQLEKKNTSLEVETITLRKEVSSVKFLAGKRPHVSMMVLVLAFVFIFPLWTMPMSGPQTNKSLLPEATSPPYVQQTPYLQADAIDEQPFDYSTTRYRSRTLLQFDEVVPTPRCSQLNQSDWQPHLDSYLRSVALHHPLGKPLTLGNHTASLLNSSTLRIVLTATVGTAPSTGQNHTWKQTLLA